jgi:hypothetical protein
MKYLKQRYPVLHHRLSMLWAVALGVIPMFILISLAVGGIPKFEKMFIDCVNESWRSKYIYERSKAIPKMRREAIEDTKERRLAYQKETEQNSLLIAYPMRNFRIFVSITEKLKSVSDKSYCKNLIITGKYSYTFQDQSYFSTRWFDIGSFSRPPYRSESLNGYIKNNRFGAMFRDFIFGEDKRYWQTVLSKAERNM